MDLDELKDRTRSVKAPAITPAGSGDPKRAADDLISRMKSADAKDANTMRQMMMLFGVAGVFCTLIFTLTWLYPPDQDPGLHRVLFALMALLFLSFGWMHRAKSRRLAGIDYAMPVRSFLDDSEKRYRFINLKDLAFMIPSLVILLATCGVGWIHAIHRYFPAMDDATGIIVYGGLIVVSGVIGFIIGRKDWQERKAPILAELRRMKEELMREEAGDTTGT